MTTVAVYVAIDRLPYHGRMRPCGIKYPFHAA